MEKVKSRRLEILDTEEEEEDSELRNAPMDEMLICFLRGKKIFLFPLRVGNRRMSRILYFFLSPQVYTLAANRGGNKSALVCLSSCLPQNFSFFLFVCGGKYGELSLPKEFGPNAAATDQGRRTN